MIPCIRMQSYTCKNVMYMLGICYMILVRRMMSLLGLGSWWPSSHFCGESIVTIHFKQQNCYPLGYPNCAIHND